MPDEPGLESAIPKKLNLYKSAPNCLLLRKVVLLKPYIIYSTIVDGEEGNIKRKRYLLVLEYFQLSMAIGAIYFVGSLVFVFYQKLHPMNQCY